MNGLTFPFTLLPRRTKRCASWPSVPLSIRPCSSCSFVWFGLDLLKKHARSVRPRQCFVTQVATVGASQQNKTTRHSENRQKSTQFASTFGSQFCSGPFVKIGKCVILSHMKPLQRRISKLDADRARRVSGPMTEFSSLSPEVQAIWVAVGGDFSLLDLAQLQIIEADIRRLTV